MMMCGGRLTLAWQRPMPPGRLSGRPLPRSSILPPLCRSSVWRLGRGAIRVRATRHRAQRELSGHGRCECRRRNARGLDYASQLSVGLDVDWGRLAGLRDFSTHLLLLNRSGRPAGRDYVGDTLFNENEIYGAGGNVVAHLGYAYIEQTLTLPHGDLDLMAGRMGAAMLFDASPLYCDFFSFRVCPTPRAVTDGSGGAFIMPPQTNWALFAGLSFDRHLYVRTGLSAAGGTLDGRSGFDWSDHGVTG